MQAFLEKTFDQADPRARIEQNISRGLIEAAGVLALFAKTRSRTSGRARRGLRKLLNP